MDSNRGTSLNARPNQLTKLVGTWSWNMRGRCSRLPYQQRATWKLKQLVGRGQGRKSIDYLIIFSVIVADTKPRVPIQMHF